MLLFRALALCAWTGVAIAATAPVLTYSTYLRDSFTPNAIAIDTTGNLYLAGSAVIDPVTQGKAGLVVKLNPQLGQYIYQSFLNGQANQVVNAIAVDASGNAYVAGTNANGEGTEQSFVAKLDLDGDLLFSTPIGGSTESQAMAIALTTGGQILVSGMSVSSAFPSTAGAYSVPNTTNRPYLVELDPTGTKTIFSATGSSPAPGVVMNTNLPALAAVPSGCLPNQLLITNSAYVAQIDGASGNVLNTQFIGGDTLTISSVALAGSVLWAAGATNDPGVPYTSNALTLTFADLPNMAGLGAYLGAVDFSQPQPPAGTPQIYCVLDGADLAVVGPGARLQLLTIFGSGLGPATGVSSTDSSTTTLAGVEVSFGGTPAPLLYVSSDQINLAIPVLEPNSTTFSPLQVSVAGAVSSSRALPITYADPNLFLNYSLSLPVTNNSAGFVAFALNADGSLNSPANPAQLGSTISVFVNALVPNPDVTTAPLQFSVTGGWTVTGFEQITPFVFQVNLQAPSALTAQASSFSCPPGQTPLCTVGFALYYGEGGPPQVPISSGSMTSAVVYVSR